MTGGSFLYVILFLKLCDMGNPKLIRPPAKIMTPTNGNSVPTGPVFNQAASTASPQWVSVNPVVVNPTQQPSSGTNPAGGTPPNGSSPPGAGGTGTPGGAAGGGPPSGASPGGGPPSGASPGGGPPSGTPPNGASPPAGSGSPPPLMGNIVAGPELPPRSLPSRPPSDIGVVSAEVIDNSIDIVDRKCDLYYSMVQSPSTGSSPRQSSTPMVMIYGGTNSAEKEFPHMASLGFGDPNAKQWLCAGSLITENFVLTAAHCMSASPLGEVRYVKLGHTRLNQDTQNTQQFNIVKRIQHEQYDSRTQYYDIALLQLDRLATITEYVIPICLFSSTNYEDRNLIATGWGKTESGTVSQDLKKVGLELFTQAECQNVYSVVPKSQLPLGIQESIQVCAGSRTESKDTCQGDSGGPLQIRKNNKWYLIGITSIGIKCGNVNSPGVYTRVASFIPWIQQRVWNK